MMGNILYSPSFPSLPPQPHPHMTYSNPSRQMQGKLPDCNNQAAMSVGSAGPIP